MPPKDWSPAAICRGDPRQDGLAGRLLTFSLQGLYTSTDQADEQSKQDAVDVQQYSSLVFQVRKPVAGTGTSDVLTIQHAATLDDSAFVDTSATFNLLSTTSQVVVLANPLRFVRWSRTGSGGSGGGSPQFMIDVVARESS